MRRIGFAALLFAIGISPRIPLGVAIPDRRFDLRIEDVILAGLLLIWLVRLLRGSKLHIPRLHRIIAIYVVIAVTASGIAIVTLGLNPITPLVYLGKEVEFFLLALLLANWVRTSGDLRLACTVLLAGAVINAGWVAWQVVTFTRGPLFTVQRELAVDVYENPALLESYGPTLIAEASALSTGFYFLFALLLCLSFWVMSRPGGRRWWYGSLAVAFSACLAASFSRISLLGAVVGSAALSTQADRKTRIRIAAVGAFLAVAMAAALVGMGFVSNSDRLTAVGIGGAISERALGVWETYLNAAIERAPVGYGKGAGGVLPMLPHGEAHNYYLRIFLETGALGLAAFLAILIAVVGLGRDVARKSTETAGRAVAAAAAAAALALSAGAFFQDAFLPVLVNEYWWSLIGLTAAARRMAADAVPAVVELGPVPIPRPSLV